MTRERLRTILFTLHNARDLGISHCGWPGNPHDSASSANPAALILGGAVTRIHAGSAHAARLLLAAERCRCASTAASLVTL